MRLRVLSWSLEPGESRWQDLAAALAGWDWDVALLREVPSRWAVPTATALDAELRCATRGGAGSWLRRLLRAGPVPILGDRGLRADVVLARRDRIAAQWPEAGQRLSHDGVHAARLAYGIWAGTLGPEGRAQDAPALRDAVGSDPLVLAGPGAGPPSSPLRLTEVGRGGRDAVWASAQLVAVGEAQALAGGAVRGHPPLVVTLEHTP